MLSIIKDEREYYDDETTCTSRFYTLAEDGREIGEATMEVYDDGTNYLARLDVNEDERGKGYGTALIQKLVEIYGSVIVTPDNEDAARLYARLGTSIEGTPLYDESFFALDNGFGVYSI